MINETKRIEVDDAELSQHKRIYKFNPKLVDKLRIPDIQKVLTSKTYKHHKSENYEEF